jgi:hypothetical protein
VAHQRGRAIVGLAFSAVASFAALAGCDQAPLISAPSATSTVTPAEGGSVVRADGRARLDVPPGAVTAPVSITIVETTRPAPAGLTARSPVFDFTPAGLAFQRPARVTLAFEAAVRPVIFWSNASGGFDPISGFPSDEAITGAVTHFSSGFVGELVDTPPPPERDAGSAAPDAIAWPTADATASDAPVDAGPPDAPVDAGTVASSCEDGQSCTAGSGCASGGTDGCVTGCTCGASGTLTCTVQCPASPPPPSCSNVGRWVNRAVSAPMDSWPFTRISPALVYDVATSRTVMYGGYGGPHAVYVQDTWEWNGAAGVWTERTGSMPAIFSSASATYDGARERLVMFANMSAELWEWNGPAATWQQRAPLSASAAWPTPEMSSTAWAAYDPDRQRIVVFEGAYGAEPRTWELDPAAATWTDRSVSPRPSTLQWLVWDPARKRCVGFGGQATNEVWEWDGQAGTWTMRPIAGTWPDPRSGAVMVLDASAGRPLLFGGQALGGPFNPAQGPPSPTYDTRLWEWQGELGQWRVVDDGTSASTPAGRTSHAMAYDSARSVVVMFGGSGPSMSLTTTSSELWEWTRTPPDAGCDAGP